MIDLKTLKKIFKDNPNKSKITFKGKCSDCGCKVIIDIISETEGFGLQGGVLYKFEKDGYFAKCPDCYGAFLRQCLNSKINYTTSCHLIEIKN